MNKLTLDPETLRVQSFTASEETREEMRPEVPVADRTRPQICDPLTAWC